MSFFFISGVCHGAMRNLNNKRNNIGVNDVMIDKKLCEEAQEYASVLANSKYYRHAAPEELNGCGETLHATTTTDTSWDAWEKHLNAAIESWWNEKNRLGDSFFGNDGKGNNYTQLAWKGTKKFGIGAVASSKNWIFVVARYYPAGNVQGRFVENVPGWETSFDNDSSKSGSIKNHRMNNALPASMAVSNALNGNGLHTDDNSGFSEDAAIKLPEPQKIHDPHWSSIKINPGAITMGNNTPKKKTKTKKEIFDNINASYDFYTPTNSSGTHHTVNYQPAAGGGYIGSFIGTSRIIDSDEADEITRRNQQEAREKMERANRTPSPTMTQRLANGYSATSVVKTPFKEKKARKKAAKKSPKKSEDFTTSFFPKKSEVPVVAPKVIQIMDSGFQFKKLLTFNSNVNSSWKQEALNGDYEYVGMSKFDEPYFKRSYGGKDVFLSLWGPEGKRKWRIGPDVNTKVCWLYTKKRSANFGIPLNGWYQSNAGGWELIEDVKISMRD